MNSKPFFAFLLSLTWTCSMNAQTTPDTASEWRTRVSVSKEEAALIKQYSQEFYKEKLPIYVMDHHGDSTFCYISAFNDANRIAKNPPTGILTVGDREVLVYGKKQVTVYTNKLCLDVIWS